MDEKKCKIIRYAFGWFLSTLIVLCGGLLIGQALAIFYSGGAVQGAYTREIVGHKLLQISAPLIIMALSVIAAYVLYKVFPLKEARSKNTPRYTLKRLESRATVKKENLGSFEHAVYESITSLKRRLWGVGIGIIVVVSICLVAYLANTANYDKTDVNATMWAAFIRCFPWIAVAFGWCLLVDLWASSQVNVQIVYLKKQDLSKTPIEKTGTIAKVEGFFNSKTYILTARIALFALAVGLLIWGVLIGGPKDILQKAVNICTECIGLG